VCMERNRNKDASIAKMIVLLVAVVLAVGAIVAICAGRIRVGKGGGHEISAAADPVSFWAAVVYFLAWACLIFYTCLKKHDANR